MTDILEQAHALGKAITKTEAYKAIQEAKALWEADEEAQRLEKESRAYGDAIRPRLIDGTATQDEMMKLVVELASAKQRQYSVPDENMLLTGFSMGGGACCELAADYPGFFAKFLIVGAAGRAEAAKKARGEFYLAVGANDRVVPPANVEATAERLGRAGCRVRLEKLSGRGHLDGGIAAYSGEARVWLLRPGKKFKRAPRSGSCGN